MAKKKPNPLAEFDNLCVNLQREWDHWYDIYNNGCSDPSWEDGCNLNLVNNHIIYDRREITRLSNEHGFDLTDIFYLSPPGAVDNKYMAKPDEIREQARKSYEIYLADENYQYMLKNISKVDKKSAEKLCLSNILGYVNGIKLAIEKDALVEMRRHRDPGGYLRSFKSGAESIKEYFEGIGKGLAGPEIKKETEISFNDKFYKLIMNVETKKPEFVEALGFLWEYNGFAFYITHEADQYVVTEGRTGLKVTERRTLKSAQSAAKNLTNNKCRGKALYPPFAERLEDCVKQYGESPTARKKDKEAV